MSTQIIEDQLALKELVDTFSNLADTKDTKAQMDLFTDDAEVISKVDGKTFASKGKKYIEKSFADYLKLFDVVYHLMDNKQSKLVEILLLESLIALLHL